MNSPEKNIPYIEPVFKAAQFIEKNLQDDIGIADVADAVFYSLYHFCRCFNAVSHITPYDYLIKRRLTRAAAELKDSSKKIIDIAFDYQFNSPETFSRAFKRMFGLQPNQYRKKYRLDRRLFQHKLTKEHLLHYNNFVSLKPELLELKSIHLTGIAQSGEAFTAEGIKSSAEEAARYLAEPENFDLFEAVLYPGSGADRIYLAAAELGESSFLNITPFVTKTFPAMNYACFTHLGSPETIALSLDYIYQIWLPRFGKYIPSSYELRLYGAYSQDECRLNNEIKIYIPLQS